MSQGKVRSQAYHYMFSFGITQQVRQHSRADDARVAGFGVFSLVVGPDRHCEEGETRTLRARIGER